MGVIKSAVGDVILTSMWVFTMPFLGIFTFITASFIGIEPRSLPSLFTITLNLATLRLFAFSFISALLGGASFNSPALLASYAAGLKPDATLMSLAIRFPAQAVGGVVGVAAIMQSMPRKYKHMVKPPTLNMGLETGAIVGLYNLIYCLSLLVVMNKGPKNFLLKLWMMGWARTIIGLVVARGKQMGTPMNPANAFGWAYHASNLHNNWEFFYVYWVCSFIGATLAAWVFRLLFKASNKHKQA